MKLLALLLVAAASSAHQAQPHYDFHEYKLRYDIFHQYDGTPIDYPIPPYVELSVDEKGDLRVDVAAQFFNSPNQAEPVSGKCPANPYYFPDLHKYNEAVVVFFANDQGKYVQFEISPRGQYVVNLLTDRDTYGLTQLKLCGAGVQLHNPNYVDGVVTKDGKFPWTATFAVPKEYLPANVTKFNAHFVHGGVWGEVVPSKTYYESVYISQDYRIVAASSRSGENGEPDLRFIGSFRGIKFDEIGYVPPVEYSDVWKSAIEKKDFEFTYNFTRVSDCAKPIFSDDYRASVTIRKNRDAKKVFFHVRVTDRAGVKYAVPEPFQHAGPHGDFGYDHESVWFNYRSATNKSVRFGVNPYGAYVVQLRDDFRDVVLTHSEGQALLLENPQFVQGADATWEAKFEIPWAYLPKDLSSLQIIHFHKPLAVPTDGAPDEKAAAVNRYEFVSAIYPGFTAELIDWRGAGFDGRAVVDPDANVAFSPVWVEAIDKAVHAVEDKKE